MATKTLAYDPRTGATKPVAVGFSWTTLLFGFWPALFRGDFLGALIGFAIGFFTMGLGYIVWAFFYNDFHRNKVLEKGYVMNAAVPAAAMSVTPPPPPPFAPIVPDAPVATPAAEATA